MFAVSSVLIAVLTVLLVKGSLIYYRHPAAPQWLKDNKSLQTGLSSSMSIGVVASIFLMGQFFADFKHQQFGLVELGLIAVPLAGGVFGHRWLKEIERRLGKQPDVRKTMGIAAAHPDGRKAA